MLIAGCGGGGGQSSGNISVDPGLFTPNYVSALPGLYHWDHLPVRVKFNLPGNWATLFPSNPDLQIDGANEWNQSGLQPLYVVVTSGTVDVPVDFVDQSTLGGSIQGKTRFTYETTGRMLSASVQVALDDPSSNPLPAGDIQGIIAHELGHALGIGGHSPLSTDLMYGSYVYGYPKVTSVRDLNTAMTAYPSYFCRGIPLNRGMGPRPVPEIRTTEIE